MIEKINKGFYRLSIISRPARMIIVLGALWMFYIDILPIALWWHSLLFNLSFFCVFFGLFYEEASKSMYLITEEFKPKKNLVSDY